jgi:hypothetical protein
VWPHATSLFFIKGRLSFYHVGGEKGGTAGAPSVLIAYGDLADKRLQENAAVPGQYLQNIPNNIFRLRLKNSKKVKNKRNKKSL